MAAPVNPFGSGSKAQPTTPSAPASSGAVNPFAAGGAIKAPPAKGKGGFFGGALRVGGSLLGEVSEFLSAPQQALFKGVKGVGQIATGDARQGIGTLASAGKSGAMFGTPGLSFLLEDKKPITPTQALQPYGVNKMPKYLDGTLQVVADPLNVATFGTGSLAKAGLKAAGTEAAEQIAKKGLRSLPAAEKAALRTRLVESAAAGGAKNAEKTAAKQLKALSARGRGGIGVRIPGTGIGAPIIPGTAMGAIGRATGATAAKGAVKGLRPVQALRRGLVPLENVTQVAGAEAAQQVGEAKSRFRHVGATLAEDWDARVLAAKDDYAAQVGKKFEEADDEFVHAALEAGPEAVAAAKAARPELARVLDTFDSVRGDQAAQQRARGLMLETDEVRGIVTAKKQAPVRARIAGRDAELEELNTVTAPLPAPPSAAQQRATGKLAERVRRAEATERGEVARGQRLMESSGRTVERAQTTAANRGGQVMGRARERMLERDQLDTGVAARRKQAELKARREAKLADAADARGAKLSDKAPKKAAASETAALDERISREIKDRVEARKVYDAVRAKEPEGGFDTLSDEGNAAYQAHLKELEAAAVVLRKKAAVVDASMKSRPAAVAKDRAAAAKTPKLSELSPKGKAQSTAAAHRAAAGEATAEAKRLEGVPSQPSRGEVQSRISRDSRLANEKSAAETGTTAKMAGHEAKRQAEAVSRAQKRVSAAKTQEQATLASFELKNAQRAERAVDRRVTTLVERNIKDNDLLDKIARDVLDDPNIITDDRYLKRLRTPEGQKLLGEDELGVQRTGGSVSSATRQASLKMRTLAREYTSKQINEAIDTINAGGAVADETLDRAVRGIAQQLKPGEKLYRESATQSLSARGVEAAQAIAAADFVKEMRGIADDTGRSILLSADDVATLKLAGEELGDGLVEFKIGKLGTFYATKAVKDEIVGAMGRLDDPSGLRKAFDTLDKWWRSQVTASLPGGVPFAARNARTNVMLMWLSGTNVPKYMAEGLSFQRTVAKAYKTHAADVADMGVEAAMRKHLGEREFKVWDFARKSGIIGDGYYAIDLGAGGAAAGAARGGKVGSVVRAGFGTQGAAAVKGRAMNNWVEQHARLSQFLADVDRLGDLEEAARRTKDVLFDYSALTPAEREIKRWGMPFYTFARKNIPGQVRRFVESPGRFVLPEKVANATTNDLPEGSPEYQERQGSRVSKVAGLAGMVTRPERPLHAAASTLDPLYQLATGRGQQGLRGVVSNLGGVPGAPAKAVFEQATGTSSFTGFKLPKAADERQRIAAQTAVPSLARAWPVTARLRRGEVGFATEAQQRKLDANGLAQLLTMLGVNLQPADAKEIKRQGRLAKAAKAAEKR